MIKINALKIVLSSLLSIAELFILAKLMGKRQISQMSFFDYINGITIGSIAAEMAIGGFKNILPPAIAMVVYSAVALCISIVCDKSIKCRQLLCGKPTVIMDKDKIYRKGMKKAKLDLNELLMQARINGFYDLSKIQTIILEANGTLSFLPKSEERPLTPADMNMTPTRETVFTPLIIDGRIIEKNLILKNKSLDWLNAQLKKQNAGSPESVLLALFNGNELVIYDNEK